MSVLDANIPGVETPGYEYDIPGVETPGYEYEKPSAFFKGGDLFFISCNSLTLFKIPPASLC
jgi:hypothetical protein